MNEKNQLISTNYELVANLTYNCLILTIPTEKRTQQSIMKNSGGLNIPEVTGNVTRQYKQVIVASFIFQQAILTQYHDGHKVFREEVHLECSTEHRHQFKVVLEKDDFENKRIKSAIERATNESVFRLVKSVTNKDLNELLYNYIKSIWLVKTIYAPTKPGFFLHENEYRFTSHNFNHKFYETPAVRNVIYEFITDDTFDSMRPFYEVFQGAVDKSPCLLILFLLHLSAFFYTPLKSVGCDFKKLIVVTGCDQRKQEFLWETIKVYEREPDSVISLNQTSNTLQNIISERKDEIVVFDDTYASKQKLDNNIKLLIECFVKREHNTECYGMLLCNQGQTMELLRTHSDKLIWIDLQGFDLAANEREAIVTIRKNIQQCLISLSKTGTVSLTKYIGNPKIASASPEMNTFAAILKLFHLCCSAMSVSLYDEATNLRTMSQFVDVSKQFYSQEAIAKQFKAAVSAMIANGELFYANSENDLPNNVNSLPVAFLHDDLLLFTVDHFKQLESRVPYGLIDMKHGTLGTKLREILRDQGYLLTNNGDKMLYKVSVSLDDSRRNLVAIKRSFFANDIAAMIPQPVKAVCKQADNYIQPNTEDGIDRILLGHTVDTNAPVYWSIGHHELANKHLYIQADSGKGKTTLLFLIAQRLVRLRKQVIILDFAEKESYSVKALDSIDKGLDKSIGLSLFEQGFYKSGMQRIQMSEVSMDSIPDFVVIRCSPIEAVYFLRDLFRYLNNTNQAHEKDVYVILDEINSLNSDVEFSNENKQSVVDVIFRQGRSIGLNLISATQSLSKAGSQTKQKLFNQSATRLTLGLEYQSAAPIAKAISYQHYEYYRNILQKLSVGEAIVYRGIENGEKGIDNDLAVQIRTSPQ